ncbi:CO(2)-response secreted protease-like isoform X1 [Nicotiana sylvestris]|uniref:CO(2)-response secreted protease-like isoform X1 n=1 Tax=Nicotiana sylvestris TaxID=4096 RepID=UPI00388CD824
MGPVKELAPKVMISILPAAIATAAGSPVAGASYCGLAAGTAKGGSPGSRIAVYRICTPYGCSGSAIMKAFDYALADGVDIINLSIGQPAAAEFEFSRNPIAIGAFHAVEKGILVVTSAGNDGPLRETVVNVVPWIFTVSATTIDRNIETHIPLGRNKLIKVFKKKNNVILTTSYLSRTSFNTNS